VASHESRVSSGGVEGCSSAAVAATPSAKRRHDCVGHGGRLSMLAKKVIHEQSCFQRSSMGCCSRFVAVVMVP
jgi:hypothetical protein